MATVGPDPKECEVEETQPAAIPELLPPAAAADAAEPNIDGATAEMTPSVLSAARRRPEYSLYMSEYAPLTMSLGGEGEGKTCWRGNQCDNFNADARATKVTCSGESMTLQSQCVPVEQ